MAKTVRGDIAASAYLKGKMHPHPEALYYNVARTAVKAARNEADEYERKQHVAVAMVFSALCLESFINQEYVRHSETNKIFEEGERGLQLETKWLMLPLLLGNKATFDRGTEHYQVFRDLVQTRNERLVHFKPQREIYEFPPDSRKQNEPYFSDLLNDVERAEKYVNCVGNMIRKLNELTSKKTDIPAFLSNEKYLSRVVSSATSNFETL
jgi:hypothetical protein